MTSGGKAATIPIHHLMNTSDIPYQTIFVRRAYLFIFEKVALKSRGEEAES